VKTTEYQQQNLEVRKTKIQNSKQKTEK